jgi:RNA polymerase sigma factor (sigma-70 family)
MERLRRPAFPRDGGGFTDGQLLEVFLDRRQETAFAALVQRHGAMVLGVCRRVLKNVHDADDAFQATFLVLVRKANALVSRENIGNWLYGVAYHTALKARALACRRRLKERQVMEMSKPATLVGDVDPDLLALLDRELHRLPDKYREAVVLCDLEGKARKTAATQLRIPESTLSSRLDRARAMLGKRLKGQGLTLSAGAPAMLSAQSALAAGIPRSLVLSTARAARLFAAGKTAALSAHAITLTQGVLKTMLFTKCTMGTVILLALSVIVAATGFLTRDTPAAEQDNPRKAPVPQAQAASQPEAPGPAVWKEAATLSSQVEVDGANALAFSPDNKTLAVAGYHGQGAVELWDLTTRRIRATVVGQPGNQDAYAAAVAFTPDGRRLALGGGTRGGVGTRGDPAWLKLCDLGTKKQQEIDHEHSALIKSLAFSPDGKTLTTGSWDFSMKLFDVAGGKLLANMSQGPRGSVSGVAFSPDGTLLASANSDGTVKLWDVATFKEKASFGQPQDFFPIISCVAFSPDGKTLAAGTWNKEPEGAHDVFLFDVATGTERRRLPGHTAWIQTVAFTPDGKTLASAGNDRKLKLWDVSSGRELATLTSGTAAAPDGYHFLSVAFSRDGKTLAAGGDGQAIKLWTR